MSIDYISLTEHGGLHVLLVHSKEQVETEICGIHTPLSLGTILDKGDNLVELTNESYRTLSSACRSQAKPKCGFVICLGQWDSIEIAFSPAQHTSPDSQKVPAASCSIARNQPPCATYIKFQARGILQDEKQCIDRVLHH
jgi:hypothetical protein